MEHGFPEYLFERDLVDRECVSASGMPRDHVTTHGRSGLQFIQFVLFVALWAVSVVFFNRRSIPICWFVRRCKMRSAHIR